MVFHGQSQKISDQWPSNVWTSRENKKMDHIWHISVLMHDATLLSLADLPHISQIISTGPCVDDEEAAVVADGAATSASSFSTSAELFNQASMARKSVSSNLQRECETDDTQLFLHCATETKKDLYLQGSLFLQCGKATARQRAPHFCRPPLRLMVSSQCSRLCLHVTSAKASKAPWCVAVGNESM